MNSNQHPSMHHFTSKNNYYDFVAELATNEAKAIEEWGGYEVAVAVIVQVEARSTEIQVGGGSVPEVENIDTPLCPVTVLEHSDATSGLPRDEIESISHLAAELLEQDLEKQTK